MAQISLSQQVEEVASLRTDVYPRMARVMKIRASEHGFRLQRIEAAHRSLKWLAQHEAVIRERCPELFEEAADGR